MIKIENRISELFLTLPFCALKCPFGLDLNDVQKSPELLWFYVT